MWRVLLKSVNYSRAGNVASVLIIIALITYNHYLRARVIEVQTIYANPKTVETIKVQRVEGPVRVITIIKERPGGERETTIKEERAQIFERFDSDKETKPEPMAASDRRRNRILFGVGLLDMSDDRRPMALGGISFANKLDLLYGANSRHGELQHNAFFIVRF